jgi:hypothetical protein
VFALPFLSAFIVLLPYGVFTISCCDCRCSVTLREVTRKRHELLLAACKLSYEKELKFPRE